MQRLNTKINGLIKKNVLLSRIGVGKELYLFAFFVMLFVILIFRLFYIQVVKHKKYDTNLNSQHISQKLLQAERGHIYSFDKSQNPIKLTENITMYDVFVDPQLVHEEHKSEFINIISPTIYKHLCETYGMQTLTKKQCIKNIEIFSDVELLPKEPEFFYYGSGVISEGYESFDWTGFNNSQTNAINNFTGENAIYLIKKRLNDTIKIGVKDLNLLGDFENKIFVDRLLEEDFYFLNIWENNSGIYDIYVDPHKIRSPNKDRSVKAFKKIIEEYGYLDKFKNLDNVFYPQENRYVKIISQVNPYIAQEIKKLKNEHYQTRYDGIPILHGLGLESQQQRYYPLKDFMSHIIGYVDQDGKAFYGIEQYFDNDLMGRDGKIIGRSSAWLGTVGANEFEIEDVIEGKDIFLTIDLGIQKELETIAKQWTKNLRSDSVSILVYNPHNGQIIASINHPSFDPNNYNDAYTLKSLDPDLSYLIDNETYIDIPVYVSTGGQTKIANSDDRKDIKQEKYVYENVYGPQVFLDKNISVAYEPGSVFKAFTLGIGLDTDEVKFYDFYNDPGSVKIGPYTIKNADLKNCIGDKSFLEALIFSCNIGMIRIAQRVGIESYFNYITKLGLGQKTGIELANEEEGILETNSSISMARYLNNAFGQGLSVTPLQIAAGYGALVNGGKYIKPSIIRGIYDPNTDSYRENTVKIVRQVIRPETSESIKQALFEAMEKNKDYIDMIRIDGYTLGGKSGTSQISYKGKYQQGLGRTNGSFVGLVSKENPEYVVVIQVRRPRTVIWGSHTAGPIFHEVAEFLLGYSFIEK